MQIVINISTGKSENEVEKITSIITEDAQPVRVNEDAKPPEGLTYSSEETYTEEDMKNLIVLLIRQYSTDTIKKAMMHSYGVKDSELTVFQIKESLEDFLPDLQTIIQASKIIKF